jgi:hypothetical protein
MKDNDNEQVINILRLKNDALLYVIEAFKDCEHFALNHNFEIIRDKRIILP